MPALQARAARGFKSYPPKERARRLGGADELRPAGAETTTGLVAYLDGEPVGWCAVEPRPAYEGLLRVYRVPWEGRQEDKTDASVWAVTCVFARAGYRKRGIGYALAKAAVKHAKERGARALEAYPMLTEPGETSRGVRSTWERKHLRRRRLRRGQRPGIRRLVMRIDFERYEEQHG